MPMQWSRILKTIGLGATLSISLSRCGGDGTKGGGPGPRDPSPAAAPSEGQDPPPAAADSSGPAAANADGSAPTGRRFTESEVMTLVGLSATQSQTAYGHCRDVLAQGIFDRYRENVSDTVKHALKERFCSMAEDEFAEKVQTFFNEERSDSHSSSHDDSFGLKYMQYIELSLATAGSASDSSAQAVTRAQALDTARKWKTSHCGDSASAQASDFEHTVLSESIDPAVIAAWRSCVTKASNGFFCESSETSDTVSVHLHWDPNAVQATLLPRLMLRQQTAHNLKLTSEAVPATLGTGSGVSITYRRIDPDKPSVFEAQGSDAGHQVDFNCSIQVSKVVRGKNKQDPSCGIRELNEGRGPVCGPERFVRGSGAVCGVAAYRTRATPACGVRSHRVGPHPECPGSVTHDVHFFSSTAQACVGDAPAPAPCPEGYMDLGVDERTRECRGRLADANWTQVIARNRTCDRREVLASCPRPEFGVAEYRLCEHPSHGVERYQTCEHETFGVAAYRSCRNAAFGATYEECFVPD